MRVCSDVVLQIQSHDHHCKRIPPTKRCCPMKGAGGLNKLPPQTLRPMFISTASSVHLLSAWQNSLLQEGEDEQDARALSTLAFSEVV